MTQSTPKTQQDAALATAKAYFSAYEQLDTEAVIALFADDISYVIPFSATGGLEPWSRFSGKAQAAEHVHEIGERYQSIAFKDKQFTVSADGRWVFFEATGNLVAKKNSQAYQNKYIIKFGVNGGKITQISEYANPVTFAKLSGHKLG